MKKNIDTCNRGFSLLELTIVVIIITILISAAIPALTRAYLEKAANKTALDMSTIEEAARAYYINTGTWPGTVSGNPMGDLTGGNYLPSTWTTINPFGTSSAYNYSMSVPTSGLYVTVYTYVPTAAQPIIENLLPSTGIDTNNNVYSNATVPGGIIRSWGAAVPMNVDQSYYAATDGYVEYTGIPNSSTGRPDIQGLTDSSNPPRTVRQYYGTFQNINGAVQYGQGFPVRKGDYWEVQANNGSVIDLYWVPLNS